MKRLARYAEARAPDARVGNALEVCLLCRARSLAALVSLLPKPPSVRRTARVIEKLCRLFFGALRCAKPLEKARLAALKAHLVAIFSTLLHGRSVCARAQFPSIWPASLSPKRKFSKLRSTAVELH